MTQSRCRSCGEGILWAVTPGRRRIPLNLKPTKDGNIRLEVREGDLAPVALIGPPGSGTHTTHFVGCVHAKSWRRPPGAMTEANPKAKG